MAASLWRSLLACEVAVAALVAAAVASAIPLGGWSVLAIALAALALTHLLVVAASKIAAHRLGRASAESRSLIAAARSVVLETLHFGLAVLSMSAVRSPREVDPGRKPRSSAAHPLLLVHGLACNRGVWRWLQRRLRRSGFVCVCCPNLEPLRADIDRLAETLEREVLKLHRMCEGARVTIIAHSMGGLAARAMLRTLGPKVIRQIITLATPHHGAPFARVLSWPCARQMCPGSAWLTALNAAQEGKWRVPLTSIYSLDDNLVQPARSSALLGAQSFEMRGLGHFGLLVSRRALDRVMHVLEERI